MASSVNPDSFDRKIDQIDVSDRWVRCFHLVVRHGTFTAAAHHLGVGQSSVSHAIKQLETAIGAPLFDRSARGVRLTGVGSALARRVGPAFDEIDRALQVAGRRRDDGVVALSVSTSFAAWWLLPRLGAFKAEHRDIELRCITSDGDDHVGDDDADLWIPHGPHRWPSLEASRLTDERIVAVAAPAVVERLENADDPASLVDAELLHLEERYGARYDWQRWFEHHGLVAPELRGARSNDYSVIVQAALDGQGVALGWEHITGPLVDAGRLMVVGGPPIVTGEPFVVLRRRGDDRPAVRQLAAWLIATTP